MTAASATLGLVGLGAMGRNLGWHLAELGVPLAVYSYDPAEIARFSGGLDERVPAAADPADLVRGLARPRILLLMVTAGAAVDRVLDDLRPALDVGDLVIDGGNSHFRDTIRRAEQLRESGIHYADAGISGGEAGARHGASIMVGAAAPDYERVHQIFEALAARAGDSPCAARVGPVGSGHFVKMVHNGIEYALMQLIAETWRTMSAVLGWDRPQQRAAFERFNRGPAASYLLGITADILEAADPDADGYLLDHVSERAAQKGTGRWTVEAALELGVPVPVIGAAVNERMLSAGTRYAATDPVTIAAADPSLTPECLEGALYAGFLSSFAQGFALLAAASRTNDWRLDLGRIAHLWQGGCIIRADLLRDVEGTFRTDPGLHSLLDAAAVRARLAAVELSWRTFVLRNVESGYVPPCASAALAWYDALRARHLPTNLIQAQRDYFGAHGFERTDRQGRYHGAWKRPSR